MKKKSTDDVILEIYSMMQSMRAEMATKEDFRKLQETVDGHTILLDHIHDMLDRDELERLALSAQVSRHQDWIERAAPVLKVDLKNQ